MTQTCEQITDDRLLDLDRGRLEVEETRETEAHLEDCAACRARRRDVAKVAALVDRAEPPREFPASFDEEMHRRLEGLAADRRAAAERSRWNRPVGLGIAASILVSIVVGSHFLGLWSIPRSPRHDQEVATGDDDARADGDTRTEGEADVSADLPAGEEEEPPLPADDPEAEPVPDGEPRGVGAEETEAPADAEAEATEDVEEAEDAGEPEEVATEDTLVEAEAGSATDGVEAEAEAADRPDRTTPAGDLTGDGRLDATDQMLLARRVQRAGNGEGPGDLNGDGRVDVIDLLLVSRRIASGEGGGR